MALTLGTIWNLRNQAIHNGGAINLIETIRRLDYKVAEYVPIIHHTKNLVQNKNHVWISPPPNVVKLNVDVVVSKDHTTLAVVAREGRGKILKVWATNHHLPERRKA